MKQFKLREKESFIKVLKEPPAPKKKVNWSRRVYLSIFLLVAFAFVRRVYNANMIIFAEGQIGLPKQTVKFPNDIKIIDLFINEGQTICSGDTLFLYQVMSNEIDKAKVSLRESSSLDWILKEKLSIRKRIDITKATISQKVEIDKYINESISKKESMLLSGLHGEYSSYESLLEQSIKLRADIEFLKREMELLNKHLARLAGQEKLFTNTVETEVRLYDEIKYFTSPIDGVISDVFYKQNEICYKKDEMVTIHQMNNATINTFFDPEEIEHLEVGDMVEIRFPDDSKSKGVISKFFVSTYAVPSEFQKKYEPTERNVVAEVVPLTKKEEYSWNSFYKMEVEVQKKRYSLSL